MSSWIRSRRVSAAFAALSLLGLGCAATQSQASTAAPSRSSRPVNTVTSALTKVCGNPAPAQATPPHHLVVIQMENESQSDIVGSAKAPYQTQLSRECGMDTNMWAVSHPSLPNYIAENSGKNVLGTFPDCTPMYTKSRCTSTDDNLFHQMQISGHTWRSYAENMPRNCYSLNSGLYVVRHNPAVYFTDLHSGSGGAAGPCGTYDLPMGSIVTKSGRFYSDLAAGKLPTYTFVAPNLVDDAHSSNIQTGDNWLAKVIPLITSATNYRSGDTDIVIVYDEGAGTDKASGENCASQSLDVAGKQPSCHIPFIVIAPYEKAGTVASNYCTLYCFTRTVESLYHLPLLGHAGDAATRNLTTDFNLSPA
jgi:phosphatidylinositol-3-phosphatase